MQKRVLRNYKVVEIQQLRLVCQYFKLLAVIRATKLAKLLTVVGFHTASYDIIFTTFLIKTATSNTTTALRSETGTPGDLAWQARMVTASRELRMLNALGAQRVQLCLKVIDSL